MKQFIKIFTDDYKDENFSVHQFVIATLFLALFILACCLAEWLNGKW